MLSKKKGFALNKNCHPDAVDATIKTPKQTEDIGKSVSSDHTNEKGIVRRYCWSSCLNIWLLGWQALALRGDRHGEVDSDFDQIPIFS